jgi:mono/diheme cytochrome c family protein
LKRIRTSFLLALLFTGLFLLVLAAMTAAGGFLFGRVVSLRTLRTVAQITGGLAALGYFVTAGMLAVRATLLPASWGRKLLYVLPLWCLGLLLVGVVLLFAGIGTVSSFTVTWVALSAVLSLVATLILAARVSLDGRSLKTASTAMTVAGGLGLLAWVAMASAVVILFVSPPTFGGPGGRDFQPGGQGGGFQQGGGQGGGQGVGGFRQGGGQGGGFQEGGGRGDGGFRQGGGFLLGGPGRGGFSRTPLLVGGILLTIFGALGGVMIVRNRRALRGWTPEAGEQAAQVPQADAPRAGGQAALSLAAVTVIVLGAAQLVPVARTNPPVQTTVQWDSPQTQQLFTNACASCHSNETQWPWYAYVAPSSWLVAADVRNARRQFNFSELNNLQSFQQNSLDNRIGEVLQSGTMPPQDFQLMNPKARLTDAERQQLIQGLQNTLASTSGSAGLPTPSGG